jgi:hypothetical protein
MKKTSIFWVGMIISLILAAHLYAETPPKSDIKQPPKLPTFVGSVVSLQESTLTVSGGKNGQTAFNTATASWQGYSSPSEVKAGDNVIVTYQGTVDGLKKATKVAKQGNASGGGLKKAGKSTGGK